MMRKWQSLAGVLAAGLVCATCLLAQTPTTPTGVDTQTTGTNGTKIAPPTAKEIADCDRLIDAVNADDGQTALEILHNYGISEDILLAMAGHLGKPPASVALQEPFLKASVASLALTDRAVKTNVQATLQAAGAALNYERPVWMPRRPDTWAISSYDNNLLQCPVAPVMVLNLKLNDPCFIRYFKLYDRNANYLHSVVLNGPNLNNAKLDPTNYDQANHVLNALFQLIKARNPDAFVWLSVVKEDSRSDEKWLKAMSFKPDGLQISNLRQFNSPFAETRQRYQEILGTDLPMMVYGFYGYAAPLKQKGQMLAAALKTNGPQAVAAATAQLGGVGAVAEPQLAGLESKLQSLGYRGLSADWLLLEATANSSRAAPTDTSDLLDPRAGLLDTYFDEKDYMDMAALAADMIDKSSPGAMDWTAGKLYEAIAWLSQTPPKTSDAIAALDDILKFNFQNKPGRDHYILGAAKWQIYVSSFSGDTAKARKLAQWVQDTDFRADLKADFLKQYGHLLSTTNTNQSSL